MVVYDGGAGALTLLSMKCMFRFMCLVVVEGC